MASVWLLGLTLMAWSSAESQLVGSNFGSPFDNFLNCFGPDCKNLYSDSSSNWGYFNGNADPFNEDSSSHTMEFDATPTTLNTNSSMLFDSKGYFKNRFSFELSRIHSQFYRDFTALLEFFVTIRTKNEKNTTRSTNRDLISSINAAISRIQDFNKKWKSLQSQRSLTERAVARETQMLNDEYKVPQRCVTSPLRCGINLENIRRTISSAVLKRVRSILEGTEFVNIAGLVRVDELLPLLRMFRTGDFHGLLELPSVLQRIEKIITSETVLRIMNPIREIEIAIAREHFGILEDTANGALLNAINTCMILKELMSFLRHFRNLPTLLRFRRLMKKDDFAEIFSSIETVEVEMVLSLLNKRDFNGILESIELDTIEKVIKRTEFKDVTKGELKRFIELDKYILIEYRFCLRGLKILREWKALKKLIALKEMAAFQLDIENVSVLRSVRPLTNRAEFKIMIDVISLNESEYLLPLFQKEDYKTILDTPALERLSKLMRFKEFNDLMRFVDADKFLKLENYVLAEYNLKLRDVNLLSILYDVKRLRVWKQLMQFEKHVIYLQEIRHYRWLTGRDTFYEINNLETKKLETLLDSLKRADPTATLKTPGFEGMGKYLLMVFPRMTKYINDNIVEVTTYLDAEIKGKLRSVGYLNTYPDYLRKLYAIKQLMEFQYHIEHLVSLSYVRQLISTKEYKVVNGKVELLDLEKLLSSLRKYDAYAVLHSRNLIQMESLMETSESQKLLENVDIHVCRKLEKYMVNESQKFLKNLENSAADMNDLRKIKSLKELTAFQDDVKNLNTYNTAWYMLKTEGYKLARGHINVDDVEQMLKSIYQNDKDAVKRSYSSRVMRWLRYKVPFMQEIVARMNVKRLDRFARLIAYIVKEYFYMLKYVQNKFAILKLARCAIAWKKLMTTFEYTALSVF